MNKKIFLFFFTLALSDVAVAPQGLAQDQAAMQAQIDRLQTELQELRGTLEAQNNTAAQTEQKLDRQYRDAEMRLQAMEEKIKLFQETLDQFLARLSPGAAQEYKKFQAALDLVRSIQYDKALPAFQQFLKQYPKSTHKPSALFWIAECRYALKDYSQAIKDYQKFVEAYPKSEKIPQVLLKQGEGFLRLNMMNEAKVFFKKLTQDYPNSEEAALAKGKLEEMEKTPQAPAVQAPAASTPAPSTPPTTMPPPSTPSPQEQKPTQQSEF